MYHIVDPIQGMTPHVNDIAVLHHGHRHSTTTTIQVIVALAQLHLFLMAISIPGMICFPRGCLSRDGYIRTVSDGLKDNSVLATTLWGSGMTWVTSARYLGVVGCSPTYACIAHVSIIVSTYASFLTIRYDLFEIHHVLSAIVWIVSSFVFHVSTTIQGVANQKRTASYVFIIGSILGIVFVVLFAMVEFEHVISSIYLLSIISVLEVATVLSIITLDFIQSLHVLHQCHVHWY
jgi:hypothetical protein